MKLKKDKEGFSFIKVVNNHKSSSSLYGLAMVGAFVYNMQYATSFGQVLYGIFKTLVWPAYLIYGMAKMVGM